MNTTVVGPGFSPAAARRTTGSIGEGVIAVALSGLLSLVAIWIVFRPLSDWTAYPLAYTNTDDGLFNLYVIKTVVETGWYGNNPALGAPFGSEPFDFAKPETLYLLCYKVAGLFTRDIALIHNLFYLAGFPLVACSALFVLRSSLRLAWPLAIAGGQIYSWLPYHFARIEHLFLSNYLVVPIGVWLMLRVCGDRPPFFERGRFSSASAGVWVAVALIASTSLYYGFFTLVLLLGTALLESVAARSWRTLTSAMLVAVCLCGAIAINVAPSLSYRVREGANLVAAARSVNEADLYALRPVQLLLPYEGHRVPLMRQAARAYNEPRNETRYAALGVIGALGFLLLLAHLLTGHRVLPDTQGMKTLARANLLAVLFGSVGTAGTLVALFATPQFRALNRVSVFIGFFSVAAALMIVQYALRFVGKGFSPAETRSPLRVTVLVSAMLMLVGFFDQVPAAARPDVHAIATSYDGDRAFVAQIERMLPAGALVYQTPHTMFPEAHPFHREPSYAPIGLYLHSTALRSSYGGIKGRSGDNWHVLLEQVPLRNRVATLQAAGFAGLVLDRRAQPDGGRGTEEALTEIGLEGPVSSSDGTLTFYRMSSARLDEADVVLLAVGGRGFYPVEGTYPAHWYWSNGPGELRIYNPFETARRATVSFSVGSLVRREVGIAWPDGGTERVAASPQHVAVKRTSELQKGWNLISLDTADPPVIPKGTRDFRSLAFVVSDLRVAH